MEEIEKIDEEIKSGTLNPRDAKMRLAHEIITTFHGEKYAKIEKENFINTRIEAGEKL